MDGADRVIAPYSPRGADGFPSEERPLEEAAAAEFRRLEFQPGGEDFAYEVRPQQLEMSRAVARALEGEGNLVAEAGTGVGKSLAYLIPLLLHAKREGVRVMVSTHTIALQEQLLKKDIPLLKERLGWDFRAVLVKGRANYLCRRRLARARKSQRELFDREGAEAELDRLLEWAKTTQEGSRQDLREPPRADVWAGINSEADNCMGAKCPYRASCFFQRARSAMDEADLLVANHHLTFSNLALEMEDAGILPEVDALVLDEAHTAESVASDHLGVDLTAGDFEFWLKRLYTPETGKGLLGHLKAGDAALKTARMWEAVGSLFQALPEATGLGARESTRTVGAPPPVESRLGECWAELSRSLQALLEELPESEEETRIELRSLRSRGLALVESATAFLEQSLPGQVYWVERTGRQRRIAMRSAPVEVADILREHLFHGRYRSVVLTSATLAVDGTLDYTLKRLGAEDSAQLCVGSPYDYARRVKIHVAVNAPEPTEKDAYAAAVAAGVATWAKQHHGRTFALFTSDETMRRTAAAVREELEEAGLELLVQGEGLSRSAMLEAFRGQGEAGGMVLFGLESFWMGVDVKGEALTNVILTKLPFAVPGQPVVEARAELIRERGGNPFRDYHLPEAVLKFRQGFGRLMRSAEDHGTVVILDSRFVKKGYGRVFQRSIPECPIEPFWV